jgi:hypothetical protein
MMHGVIRGNCVVLATLATIGWVVPAAAAKPGQPFRLEYWAQGRCPDATEFALKIQTRAPRLRPAEGDEPALGFYAELVEQAGSATGRLTARSPDGREVVREVRGPTCDDVSTALALIAALAADPSQPVETPGRSAAGPKGSVARPARVARAEEPAPPLKPPVEAPREQPWTFGVGGGLAFDSSIAPSPGYGLSIEFDAQGKGGSPWQPLLALSANRAAAPDTDTRGGTASFTWVAFRLAACPFRWPEDKPLFVRPCAFLDTGVLSGQVSLGSQRRDQSKTWFASGGFIRIEALAAEAVSFQLDGGVTLPLRRYSFGVGGGNEDAFRTPASGILGRIGLSYRFQ